MAATRIQYVADGDGTATNSVAYPSNVTAGSMLVVVIRSSANDPADPTVTDTSSNTWARDVFTSSTTGGRVYLYSAIANSSGACTVTVVGTTATRLAAWEWGGSWDSSRLEASDGSAAGSVSPEVTGSVVSAGAGLVLAACGSVSDVTFSAVTNSFVRESTALSRLSPAYRITTGGGTYSTEYSWTGTDNNVRLAIAAYREIAGPTITVQPVADTVILSNETSASFSVTATGTGTLLYDWELEDGVGSGVYANLANGNGATWTGQTAASCSAALTAKTLTGRRVRCNVTDDNGTTTTNAVALTIWDGPQVTTFPATDGSGESTATLTSDYVTGVGEAIEVRIPLSDGDVAVTVTTT